MAAPRACSPRSVTAASATPAIARSPPTPASAQSPSNQAKANTHSSTGRAATASRRIRQARRLKPPAQPLGRRHLQPSPGQERQPPPRRSRPRARVVPGHLVPVVRPRHLQPRQANRATQTDRRGRLTIVGPPGRPHSPPATAGAAVAVGCPQGRAPEPTGRVLPIPDREQGASSCLPGRCQDRARSREAILREEVPLIYGAL